MSRSSASGAGSPSVIDPRSHPRGPLQGNTAPPPEVLDAGTLTRPRGLVSSDDDNMDLVRLSIVLSSAIVLLSSTTGCERATRADCEELAEHQKQAVQRDFKDKGLDGNPYADAAASSAYKMMLLRCCGFSDNCTAPWSKGRVDCYLKKSGDSPKEAECDSK